MISRGGESGGRSRLRKSPFGPLPIGRKTPVNSDFFICELTWGFEKDRENLQMDAEKIWGKMMKEEELK